MKWIKYLWIPVSIVLGVLAYVLFREQTQIPNFKTEKRAIDAEAKAKKLKVELGVENALSVIEAEYQEEIHKLTLQQTFEAKKLRERPEKLAAFLIRAAR